MNADLTINTLSFVQQYSDLSGSLRREVSRGPSLPTELKIAHTKIIDSSTKLPGMRHLVRFDRYLALSTGIVAPISAYAVVQTLTDTGVASADILAVVQHLNNTLFAATGNTSGLDQTSNIFVGGQQ